MGRGRGLEFSPAEQRNRRLVVPLRPGRKGYREHTMVASLQLQQRCGTNTEASLSYLSVKEEEENEKKKRKGEKQKSKDQNDIK